MRRDSLSCSPPEKRTNAEGEGNLLLESSAIPCGRRKRKEPSGSDLPGLQQE